MIKRILFIILTLGLTSMSYGQARIVMDGAIGLAMDGGTALNPIYLVIDNPNTNAITDGGATGGPAIRSDSEFNIVKWNIGSSTGTYNVPFVSLTGGLAEYVAPSLTISSAGDANGSIEFATYPTDAQNSVWPQEVLHLAHLPGLVNESVSSTTMNRFWIIDPNSYTTKPGLASVAINFDSDELDAIPDANNMVLQRYNHTAYTGNGAWADFIPTVAFISNGPSLYFIQSGPIPSSEFYRSWAISSSSTPLPISLIRFNAVCIGSNRVELSWSTASEINNDFFTIERSEDGIIWEAFDVVQGSGNSSAELNYKVIDHNPFSGLTYYRLTQTDFDGTTEIFDPVVSDCDGVGFEIISANALEASPILNLAVSAGADERFDIILYDMSGKQVLYQGNVMLYAGLNYLTIDKGDLGKGIYIINMVSDSQVLTRKVLLD